MSKDDIAVTGNTVIDALRDALRRPLSSTDSVVARATARPGRMVLVTAHRRESWGEPMRRAMAGVRQVAEEHRDVHWLVPMHRNPVVREVIQESLGDLETVTFTEPLDYHEFCHAMAAAHLVLTDSGGVQEEAPSLGKPVLVMRDNTERPEAVDAGTVELVGTDTAVVASALRELLTSEARYDEMARAVNPYGDGFAAQTSGVGHRRPVRCGRAKRGLRSREARDRRVKRLVILRASRVAPDPRVERAASVAAARPVQVEVLAWDRDGGLERRSSFAHGRIERFHRPAAHGRGMANLGGLSPGLHCS